MTEDYYPYIKDFFRRCAPTYDFTGPFISRVRQEVVRITDARDNSRILDVCTGTGKQAFAFGKKGYDVVGIDLSEDMLEVARRKNRYGNVRFTLADATNLPFGDNCFDFSCVSFALHDMPLRIRESVLEEMTRVTKPKGSLVVVDYALPKSGISGFLIFNFVRIYESAYYPEFMKWDLMRSLKRGELTIKEQIPVLFGAAKILKVVIGKQS